MILIRVWEVIYELSPKILFPLNFMENIIHKYTYHLKSN